MPSATASLPGTTISAVIGVGASAGGIHALQAFLGAIPRESRATVVIILHRSPTPVCSLAELLQHSTSLPVVEIADGMALEPGRIQVVPPVQSVRIRAGRFQLVTGELHHLSIDCFFTDLADLAGIPRAGVVLTGTGSDGTKGLLALRAAGALTAVQDPRSAAFSGMPGSAVAAGAVDLVAPVEALAGLVLTALKSSRAAGDRWSLRSPLDPAGVRVDADRQPVLDDDGSADVTDAADDDPASAGEPVPWSDQVEAQAFARILGLVRSQTGHDFSLYKPATIRRRIERRMGFCRLADLSAYAELVAADPPESRRLIKEFLIGVTRFFRDPEVWRRIEEVVVPGLLSARPGGGELRAWIPGCASGEEAYSLAMVLCEAVARTADPTVWSVQIFATDLNPLAIDVARRGWYGVHGTVGIGPTRLARFFTPEGDGYRVGKQIREVVVFAPHSLFADPPFTRIDLLSCRNLMIYLGRDAHESLLPRLHYSLTPGGVLVLGSSESIGTATHLFEPLPGGCQIYRRRASSPQRRFFFTPAGVPVPSPDPAPKSAEPMQPSSSPEPANPVTVSGTPPMGVVPVILVLGRDGTVRHRSGPFDTCFDAAGRLAWGLGDLIARFRDETPGQRCNVAEVWIGNGDRRWSAHLAIDPLVPATAGGGGDQDGSIVVITPIVSDQQVLERELLRTRDDLQAAREEMQASREELTSTNEELQSTNEELTTSAEELRTMNDELVKARSEAEQGLARYTDLFDSAPVGYFTLDQRGTVVQGNRAGAVLLGMERDRLPGGRFSLYVVEADRLRFLATLKQAFAERVQASCEVRLWREVGDPCFVRISALVADDGESCRVVAADLTEVRAAEEAVRITDEKLRLALRASNQGIWSLEVASHRLEWSPECSAIFGFPPEVETTYDMVRSAVHPDDREVIDRAVQESMDRQTAFSLEYRIVRPDGSIRWVSASGRAQLDDAGVVISRIGVLQDVTVRKEAEARQLASLATIKNLELALDQHALVSITDRHGRITYANDTFCSVSKYDRSELIGKDHRIINSGYHPKSFMVDLWRTLESGRIWKGEIRNKAKDGTIYWVASTLVPFRDAAGQQTQYVAIRTDITERKQAEELVARNYRFLKMITDSFPGIVAYWTPDLVCVYANRAFQTWWNRSAEEIPGIRLRDLLGDELFERNQPQITSVLAGKGQRFERIMTRADGARRNALVEYIPDIHGDEIRGFFVILTDITAVRSTETELRRLKELLETSQAVAQVGGWEVDLVARTVFWTAETYRIHDTTPEAHAPSIANGMSFWAPESRPAVDQAVAALIRHGHPVDLEAEVITARGRRIWVHLTSQVTLESGRPVKVTGAIQDITERRRLQTDLAQARDKALEASRLKSEFLSTMSHEIRTPMNGVIGMTELLLDSELDQEQREIAGIIKGSGENLLVIINEILDFSRIEAGKLRIDPADFILSTVVHETVTLLAPRAKEKGLELVFEVDPPLADPLRGDAGRIRQILTNLIGNAIKFTEHGQIAVSAQRVALAGDHTTVRVTVRDSGIGIAEEAQPRLFQAFTQADGSFTRKYGGTGLGLAISRQLLERMGGRIGFESALGQGSTFWFELDLGPATGSGRHQAMDGSRVRDGAGLRLLVVDDNQANRDVAVILLRAMGHEVILASDGRQALDQLAGSRFDGVLMDCQMPVMDGFEATRLIRSGTLPGVDARIPVIALTAAAMAGDRQACLDAGMDDYISKPVRREDLAAALVVCGWR